MSEYLWLGKKFEKLFKKYKLDSFEELYHLKKGQLIREESEKSIRKFTLRDASCEVSFYLKTQQTPFGAHLKRLLRRGRLYTLPTSHEVELLKFYQENSISVARVVAWGEKRHFCLTSCGFILQEEVKGVDFVDLVKRETVQKRIKLIKAYGHLVAKLHNKGIISSIVRATDIVCVFVKANDWKQYEFVIIDRESGPLHKEEFDIDKVCWILANILYKFIVYVDSPSLKEIVAFLKVYSLAMSPSRPVDWKELFFRSEQYFTPLIRRYNNQ